MRRFSYQLYSSRNFPPVQDTLRMVADLGYHEVEGYGALFEDDAGLDTLVKGLEDTGLAMPTAHIGLDLLTDPDRVISIARRLGLKTVICPFVPEADRPTDVPGWMSLGQRLSKLGDPLWRAGYAVGWHNHDFEFDTIDGVFPLNLLLEADPRLGLELDVAWVVKAGEDPVHWMTKYADRICAVHVKDIAVAGTHLDEDGWADVGYGTMDWSSLLQVAEQTAAMHFVLEHDNPSDHQRFAHRSLATLKSF